MNRIVVPLEQADENAFPGVGSPERLKEIYEAALSAMKDHPETNLIYIEIHANELCNMAFGLHRAMYGDNPDVGDLHDAI